LLRVASEGPLKQIRPVSIEGGPVPPCDRPWPLMDGQLQVGQVTSATWSPDFETNVAIGMVRITHWEAGTDLDVVLPDGTVRPAVVNGVFWN